MALFVIAAQIPGNKLPGCYEMSLQDIYKSRMDGT